MTNNTMEYVAGSTTFNLDDKRLASIPGPDGHTLCILHMGKWHIVDFDLVTFDDPWVIEDLASFVADGCIIRPRLP